MKAQTFIRIAEDIRGRILSGELGPGAYLPSHDELSRQYATTRVTVRRALEELTRDGYLVSRQPRGVMVRDTNRLRLDVGEGFAPPFPNLGDRLLTALVADRKLTRTIDVRTESPLVGLATRLRTEGAPVVLRHQVIHAGGQRVSIANVSFPEHLAAGTALEQPDPDLDVMETLDQLGWAVLEEDEEFLVRLATGAESREMWWPTGTPVLVQMRTGYTAGGVPVACWVQVLPGDTWTVAERHPREARSRIQAVG